MIDLKKGDKVILKGFTGIKLGVFEIASTTKKTVTVLKRNGDEMIFDRNTGNQVNVEEGKERYANSIIEDDGSFVAPSTKGAAKKSTKKAVSKPAPAEDEEDEEEEPVKPAKKSSKKTSAPTKKSKKSEPEEEDEDEDEFEEDDE